ncbi:MAG: phosphate/phosphite/phosphonate ABC transporter substrate-binding protein [Bacteroidota bacterium]
MRVNNKLSCILGLLAFLPAPPLHADSSDTPLQAIVAAIKKAAFTPSSPAPAPNSLPERLTEDRETLVFTAPPRETPEQAQEIYQPIADYLSKVIGKKIVYQYPGTWGAYRAEMLKGGFDLIFDGPHFNSYRMDKLHHNILVKIPERHEFAVIVRKEQKFSSLSQMAGYTFCAHAPPNLGTLVLLSQFDNPARQPVIINTNGWETIYESVVSGKCVGGVLPVASLKQYDHNGVTRMIYKTQELPNRAFSAGPRIPPQDQARIAAALTSPDAAAPTAKLRAAYRVGDGFTLANNQEYRGLAVYLRGEWD